MGLEPPGFAPLRQPSLGRFNVMGMPKFPARKSA
jgi:hypothetical protein